MSSLCVCGWVGGGGVHTVLGQQDKLVKNVCCLGMWPTPASLPRSITSKASHSGFKFSEAEWWHTWFSTNNTLLSLRLGGVEKRHVKWEMGLGLITLTLGPQHSTHISGGHRRQAVGLESSCLVRLPRGGHFTAPRHMKCWLVFASSGEARDKWRGRQMSGERGEGGGQRAH